MYVSPAGHLAEFHQAFDLPRQDSPQLVSPGVATARQRLLDEEVAEVAEAVRQGDLAAIAHELADVVYVVYGTALAYGVDLDAVLAEIHRANMTKSGVSDGKVRKGAGYRPPDVAGVLARTAAD